MAGFEPHARAVPDDDEALAPRPAAEAAAAYDAQQRLDLLHAVIDLLPVGVRVDDADGRVVLANAAAAQLPRDAASSAPIALVESAAGPDGARTFLVASRTAQVGGETLRLCGSFDITERARAENELLRLAYHDELTGLPNRSLIRERVE